MVRVVDHSRHRTRGGAGRQIAAVVNGGGHQWTPKIQGAASCAPHLLNGVSLRPKNIQQPCNERRSSRVYHPVGPITLARCEDKTPQLGLVFCLGIDHFKPAVSIKKDLTHEPTFPAPRRSRCPDRSQGDRLLLAICRLMRPKRSRSRIRMRNGDVC
jgi:hypothetical protein